jgi:serine protease Do
VKAGVQAGDVITAVNGKEVKDARDLAKTIGAMQPKTEVKLSVLRKGSEKTIAVTLGELPNTKMASNDRSNDNDGQSSGTNIGKLGLTLAPASNVAGAGRDGVIVTAVDSSGVAADHGFSTGDVILEVAGKSVASPADVRKMIGEAQSGGKRTVLMRVKKGENTRFVALPVSEG